MNNEKGSVLSVAVILIVLLSFSITTITAYTQNVASQTNTVTQLKHEDMINDAYLRLAMAEFRDKINELNQQGYDSFDDIYDESRPFDMDVFKFDLNTTYGVTINSISGGSLSRKYRFKLDDNEDLYRYMVVSMSEDGPVDYSDIFHPENGVINNYLEEFAEENIYCKDATDEAEFDACRNELQEIFQEGSDKGKSGQAQVMNGDFFIGTDYIDEGSSQNTTLDLKNNILIIDGDFTLNKLAEIKSTDGPGIVIVTGDLITGGEEQQSIALNNVLFLVQGEVNLNYKKEFDGTDFVVLSLKDLRDPAYGAAIMSISASTTTSACTSTSCEEGSYIYYHYYIDNHSIYYAGSEHYTSMSEIITWYSVNFDESASFILDFFY